MTQCANDPGCFVLFVRSTGFSRHFRLKAQRPILWTGGGGSRRPELLVDYALNWLQNQIQNRNMIPIGRNWREHRCTMRGSAGASPSRGPSSYLRRGLLGKHFSDDVNVHLWEWNSDPRIVE